MDKLKLTETVKTAQAGDHHALETLYREYAKPVFFLALKLLKNKEDAEDITQEVFIYVFRKIGELQEPEAFSTWLNRITANKSTDFLRQRREPVNIDPDELAEAEFFEESDPLLIPEKYVDNAETSRLIIEIIDNLPLTQRVCTYYYYYEHLTVAQIAENLNANESTVRTRLAVAREKIRKELERLNDEDGIKLYGAAPLMLAPIFKTAARNFEMPNGLLESMFGKITAGTASAANTAAVTAAVKKGVISMTGKAKIALIAAGIIVAGGITAGVIIANNNTANEKPDTARITGRTSGTTTTKTEQNVLDVFEDILPEPEKNEPALPFYPAQNPNERGNTVGNIMNSGDWISTGLSFAAQDGWVYFRNSDDYDNDEYGIFRMRGDGTEREKLTELRHGPFAKVFINVVGDWIYYEDGGLYKMRTNGADQTKLSDNDCYYINVAGDWIYYKNDDGKGTIGTKSGGKIYKIRTDGTEETQLNDDDSEYVNVVGDWIYYHNISDDGKLYKIKTDGTERTKLNDDKSEWINAAGDWIYYRNSSERGALYKIRTDGAERTLLGPENHTVKNINITDDWIYYNKHNDLDTGIYKIRADGTELTMLAEKKFDDSKIGFISIAGDWIYYESGSGFYVLYQIRTDGTERQEFYR